MRTDPIKLTIERNDGSDEKVIPIGSVGCARFTSRDLEATRKELDELIEIEGRYTNACLTNPSIGRIARYLLTQATEFEVLSAEDNHAFFASGKMFDAIFAVLTERAPLKCFGAREG